jgi:hypothetical protein
MATTKKAEEKSSVEANKYTPTPKINLKERLDAIKYKAPTSKVAAKPAKSLKRQRQSLKGPSGLQTLKTLQTLK